MWCSQLRSGNHPPAIQELNISCIAVNQWKCHWCNPTPLQGKLKVVSINVSNSLVFAAGSDFPPGQRCERCSRSASSAAAAESAAAAGSARWCSDRPEWHRGASPAGRTPEEQEITWVRRWAGKNQQGPTVDTGLKSSYATFSFFFCSLLSKFFFSSSICCWYTLSSSLHVLNDDCSSHIWEHSHSRFIYYSMYIKYIYILNDIFVLISGVIVQTLVAVFDSCSLKLCSICSLLCTSICFSWNQKIIINFMCINVRSVVDLIYWSKRRFHLCELIHRVLQESSCSLSLISLCLKRAEDLLHLQHLRLSLFHRQLQLQRRKRKCNGERLLSSYCLKTT